MPLGQVIQAQDETRKARQIILKSIPKKGRPKTRRQYWASRGPKLDSLKSCWLIFAHVCLHQTLNVQPFCACQNVLYIQTDRYYTQEYFLPLMFPILHLFCILALAFYRVKPECRDESMEMTFFPEYLKS